MFSVANLDILGSFVELGRIMNKETMVAYLHKTKEFSINRVTIGCLLLEDKLVKMWREKSSIIFVVSDMHMVNVGPRVRTMDIVIVGEIINRTSVVNLIRSLTSPTRWPIHNNMRETT